MASATSKTALTGGSYERIDQEQHILDAQRHYEQQDSHTPDAEHPIPLHELGNRSVTVYNNVEQEAIEKVLTVVDRIADKRREDGLTEVFFALGVLNLILITFTFGAFPEHFWVLFVCEGCVLFPLRLYKMEQARPKQTPSWLEFCWVMNFSGFVYLFLLALDKHGMHDANIIGDFLSKSTREEIFVVTWAVATGPLLGAVIALQNAIIFHDVNNLNSVFIHFFPALVCFTLRWRSEAVRKAWPTMFELDYFDKITTFHICTSLVVVYVFWLIPYSLWMLVYGMKMPQRGVYETVFHYNMRGGFHKKTGRLFGRSPAEIQRRLEQQDWVWHQDFLVYQFLQLCLTFASGWTFSVLCFQSEYLHGSVLLLTLLSSVYHGSRRYTYIILKSYGDGIRKEAGIRQENASKAAL